MSASSPEAIVGLLLARGDIRVDLVDDNGLTPLMLARSLEAVAVVKLLEEYTIDSEFNSVDGRETCSKRINRGPLIGTTVVGHQTIHRRDIARPLLCSISRNNDNDQGSSHYSSGSYPPSILHDTLPSPD
ncbi:hypothetical protein SERLA73DRAFT_190878 [Serpula lacrymans var. lacrymans S7.3]|uniref:Uncharacterized protein n=2 Tax=Serpula lacrymans var. lacrymans TaxID=341189 RepID=F8QGJ8_SERL3|nr:uncharacterized protein SERLADRAFT_456849 [Serpula lacrymans var. lacrymans S7.9]EGN92544.1 hypothetical protein SERLA73DRAFT_190878 [Serpula lacrymans var. lacrymans S7.3]EGO29288.1 hypothetical protein SERLADRAFT_456849 [Serpula lacrymans var. lacrymans S7.9]